jgi:4-alpha-glucanotransferase
LGAPAYEFLHFLAGAGQTLWQMLPIGPTGFEDSPYQCFSAFAANPNLISLEMLHDEGLLSAAALKHEPLPEGRASYAEAIRFKTYALSLAAEEFRKSATSSQRGEFESFCAANAVWLDEFATFMAAKELHRDGPWWEWSAPLRDRDPAALAALKADRAAAIERVRFIQWKVFSQWNALRAAAHARGVRLMGDIPIYAAADSADVWAARHLWHIAPDGRPALQAGVPPDYFSATGQLWGNPIYRWDVMERDGFAWWIERFRGTFALFDLVRVDHFRGFQAFWQVPGDESTAINGEWKPGPGAAIFECVEREFGKLPVLAENLGVITPEVEAIRHRFGFPGMAILQFAFGKDPQAPDFKPHNYPREVVAYTGTHDNDTTLGWWTSSGEGDSTRTAEDIRKERDHTLRYLGIDESAEINWAFVRALMSSVANTVVFPVQDLLGLGTEARMNMPSTVGRNWKWRMRPGALTPAIAQRLRELVLLYDRLPAPAEQALPRQ